ncbi:MAG TPA: hypothetical protein VND54_11935 [Candidatus Saccharimonadales bacterium]|nr:hypothetical protein [Candidatus Saccharimonadales bacterium]
MIAATGQLVQDNAAIALDWITGILALVTAVMAVATVVLGIKTAASVKVAKEAVLVAKEEADATLALVRGAREDRELAARPIVYSLSDTVRDVTPELKATPVIVVRNIGNGPAIRTRVIRWHAGRWRYTAGWGEAIAAAETFPQQPEPEPTPHGGVSDPLYWPLAGHREADEMPGIPTRRGLKDDLWAYCLDQLGNALRFNLRTGDPPEISRHDATPEEWAWVIAGLE